MKITPLLWQLTWFLQANRTSWLQWCCWHRAFKN